MTAAVWNTFAKRVALERDSLVYRDFLLREHRVPYGELTCRFDPRLGLAIFAGGKLLVLWPRRSGHPSQFAEEIHARGRSGA